MEKTTATRLQLCIEQLHQLLQTVSPKSARLPSRKLIDEQPPEAFSKLEAAMEIKLGPIRAELKHVVSTKDTSEVGRDLGGRSLGTIGPALTNTGRMLGSRRKGRGTRNGPRDPAGKPIGRV